MKILIKLSDEHEGWLFEGLGAYLLYFFVLFNAGFLVGLLLP